MRCIRQYCGSERPHPLHQQENDQLELFALRCLCESIVEKNFLSWHPHAVADHGCGACAARPFRFLDTSRIKRLPIRLICRPAATPPQAMEDSPRGASTGLQANSPGTYSKNACRFLLSSRTKRSTPSAKLIRIRSTLPPEPRSSRFRMQPMPHSVRFSGPELRRVMLCFAALSVSRKSGALGHGSSLRHSVALDPVALQISGRDRALPRSDLNSNREI